MKTPIARTSLISETKALIQLALPIIANGLLEASYGFTNNFMAAHLSEAALAANALVAFLFFTLMVIFWGIISATSIIISHHHGAENDAAIRGVVRDSLVLSLIISVPIMLLLWFAPHIFLWLGQPPSLIKIAEHYLHALAFGVPFDLLGFALMQFFQGISKPRIIFIVTLLYIPLLITTNAILIFGKFGIPAFGLAGIGWGTTLTYSVVLIAMVLYIYFQPAYRHYFDFKKACPQRYLRELLIVGAPLGGMYSIEIGYFFMLAILMGKISTTVLAANQIVTQYLWILMNVVFSIGQAMSIRIGWRLGRQEPEWVIPIVRIGKWLAILYLLLIASIYWLFPHILIAIDLSTQANPEIVNLAVALFAIAAVFQCIDGLRIILFCALRGMKDTRFTMLVSLLTFWGIALPLGDYFAFHLFNRHPAGLWLGAIISAVIGYILLTLRLRYKTTRAP